MSAPLRAFLLATLCGGCGVAGQPMPPGPLPPSAPREIRQVSTPEGVEVYGPQQHRDVDGHLIGDPVELRLYPADGPWTGPPLGRATGTPILIARPKETSLVRLIAYRGRNASRASPPFRLSWSPPAKAPTPIGFIDEEGVTRIMWPPLEDAVNTVTILRDGEPVSHIEARSTTFTERAPGSRHRYQIVIRGETFRSAPSGAVILERLPTQ